MSKYDASLIFLDEKFRKIINYLRGRNRAGPQPTTRESHLANFHSRGLYHCFPCIRDAHCADGTQGIIHLYMQRCT